MNEELIVRFARVEGNALDLPVRHSDGAAGIDLYSAEMGFSLHAGDTRILSTGWKIELPPGYVGLVKDRSSCALRGLVTQGGVIDSDYRGEVHVLLHNNSSNIRFIHQGDRIAQLVVLFCPPPVILDSSAFLSPTARGENGFGSTG